MAEGRRLREGERDFLRECLEMHRALLAMGVKRKEYDLAPPYGGPRAVPLERCGACSGRGYTYGRIDARKAYRCQRCDGTGWELPAKGGR